MARLGSIGNIVARTPIIIYIGVLVPGSVLESMHLRIYSDGSCYAASETKGEIEKDRARNKRATTWINEHEIVVQALTFLLLQSD